MSKKTPLTVQLDEHNRRIVEMPFVASEVITKVVISPHGERRQGKTLAEFFKDSKKLGYGITDSKIPFRS